ncbi:MAG: aminotransferase class IV [Pseudomonadota bacterium]
MTGPGLVYLDGAYLPASDAKISPFDRGFLFAQAAYEVTAVFNGKLIDFEQHVTRLARTLAGLEIEPLSADIRDILEQLIARNDLIEGLIYLNVSAGEHGPRDFYGPETLTPSVFAFATHKTLIGDIARDGIATIAVEDTRWKRRDLKTTQLLSQSLAYRAARRAGAHTAIMHEDGVVTEAASANLWIVTPENVLVTRDLSSALLPGITRSRVLSLMEGQSVTLEERAFTLDELRDAKEAFTSSTGVVIAPVLSIDGSAIGNGKPGPVTRQVQASYYKYIGADLSAFDWL